MLASFHPVVHDWFVQKFGTPTEPQELGWPSIIRRENTLISAPTGSGKTFAAFLASIDQLVRKAIAGTLHDQIEVVYVSPLRALSNDIQKNLEEPLREILHLAWTRGTLMQEIRAALRTGDTKTRDRQAMLRRPPHILVTTPESLFILLTAEKSRAILKNVQTVIVDEIHAVADDKRGAHLSLSLERLEALSEQTPTRIGLSATQKPIEEIARFLTGAGRPDPVIVNVGHTRTLDLGVEVPNSELGPIASHELWDEIHERIADLVAQHRSTLVFVNTRKLAERTTHRLAKKLGEECVAAHHGSLSRKLRLSAERKLKNGELKVLVATASLELGIDIGTVDLVCQIGSPRSIAVALQRAGRSGHWRGAIPKSRFFPTTRDQLLECAALVYAIRTGDLDRLEIPELSLDILTQQIVAICSSGQWNESELFETVRRAYPYRNLTSEQFESILQMLSDGIASSRGRYGAYLHRDRVQGVVQGRRGARLAAITSGGAIPETGLYTVVAEPEGNVIGTLDEDFAVESNQGDIILLGNTSWMIRRVESFAARVLVQDAHGAPPTVPFWRGEAPGRTQELSAHVARIRQFVHEAIPFSAGVEATDVMSVSAGGDARSTIRKRDPAEVIQQLRNDCGLDQAGAEQIVEYVLQGRSILGAVPTQKVVIAERFFDEGGGMQLVIHAPFGARINRAWGLALRKRFCRSFNLELQASATDDGVNISLTEQHSFPLADVFHFLHTNTVEHVLAQAAFASPIFDTRWRWDAMRSLALQRFRNGKKIPLQILRMRSEDLLAAVFPDAAACQDNRAGEIEFPDHPLITETMKDVLQEAMDLKGLKEIIAAIYSGEIQCVAVDTTIPSPFCHEILNANPYAYLDDAPLEERRARAVTLRRVLPSSVVEQMGMLDPGAIQTVVEQAWPDVRNAEELHDLLQTVIALPSVRFADEWIPYMDELLKRGSGGSVNVSGETFWCAAEKLRVVEAAYPSAQWTVRPASLNLPDISGEESVFEIIRGWMAFCGPVTAQHLVEFLKLQLEDVTAALLRLEVSGAILRGQFKPDARASSIQHPPSGIRHLASGIELEWCHRRLLERIHRLTLGALRKRIEPVTAAEFVRWLFRWQHVAPGTQLRGERGLLEVIRQLQGFELPARAWETEIFAKRIRDYNPAMLDKLCWTGNVGWGRFSSPSGSLLRTIPNAAAPVTFFVREDCQWLVSHSDFKPEPDGVNSETALVFSALQQKGASFLSDLIRYTKLRKNEVEAALWELVTLGVVTADGFDSMRSLLDRKGGRLARGQAGRWSILQFEESDEAEKRIEETCRLLLNRYGVVFRDVLQRETLIPRWRDLLHAFRRMEDRGEVRGGRFVSGFVGEQFAVPLAVDSLRAVRKTEPSGEVVIVSAADPLNLVGIVTPGDRITSTSLTSIPCRDGVYEPSL